tara:strand:- start:194 stop:745 length:552 start_codon:yes stop_codon:yes gene_type:complete
MINASRPFKNVLDAACADAKFRSYFGTSSYTGIDISRERLNSANALINSKGFANTELIEQDLTNPNGLIFTNKFDLVVSTHTMTNIISIADKQIASKNLINSINDNGYLIIQLTDNCLKTVKPILDNNLKLKKHVSYKGAISDILEKNFSGSFHMSFIGRTINLIFSYIDFGKTSDNLLLYRK